MFTDDVKTNVIKEIKPNIIKGPHSLRITEVSCGDGFYLCITGN